MVSNFSSTIIEDNTLTYKLLEYNKSNYHIMINVVGVIIVVVTWRSYCCYCCMEKKHIMFKHNKSNTIDIITITINIVVIARRSHYCYMKKLLLHREVVIVAWKKKHIMFGQNKSNYYWYNYHHHQRCCYYCVVVAWRNCYCYFYMEKLLLLERSLLHRKVVVRWRDGRELLLSRVNYYILVTIWNKK